MPKYEVTLMFVFDKTVTVEAENADEAEDKALETNGDISLCWQCSDEIGGGDVILSETSVIEVKHE